MKIIKYPARETWEKIAERPHMDLSELNATVEDVLSNVKSGGDEAVKRYEEKFDHVALQHLAVSAGEIDEAGKLVSKEPY